MSVSVKGGGGGGISSSDVTASKANVLSGYTALTSDSNDEAVSGTMVNNGAVTATVGVGGSYTIPEGFHNGSGKISGATLSGDAAVANVLTGKTFYSNSGTKQTGTMTNRGAVSQTLGINGSYTIPAGYHNGSGKVSQSITTKAAATYTPTTSNQTISAGQYLSGAQTIKGDSNLVAANILSGKSIFGVSGSMTKYACFSFDGATGSSSRYTFSCAYNLNATAATSTYELFYYSKSSIGFTPDFAAYRSTYTPSGGTTSMDPFFFTGSTGFGMNYKFFNVPFSSTSIILPVASSGSTSNKLLGKIIGHY